jgi:hypothetical protein
MDAEYSYMHQLVEEITLFGMVVAAMISSS